jgi:hypothetical protein
VDSQTPFYLPRVEYRSRDLAKVCRLIESQIVCATVARITRLEVVKDIGELHGELEANALREPNIFSQRRIHVPPGQTAKVADTAATGIDPENTTSKSVKD